MDASIRTVESESSVPAVESFLIGLSPDDIETKLESKMRRLLNKYRERKSREFARKKEWQAVNTERPNPEMDHPTDKKLIEEAKQTIGNYKLKTDVKFEATEEQRETITKKLQEILKTRDDVYNIRNDYNKKVFALRDKKKNLIEYIEKKLKKLVEIHLEIPEKQRVMPKIAVSFDFNREFPERNYDLKQYLAPENYILKLMTVEGNSKLKTQNNEKHLMDMQREVLMNKPVDADAVKKANTLSLRHFQQVTKADKEPSDWEVELRDLRTRRRLFEQQLIIEKVNARIKNFDDEIEKVSDERYEVEVRAKFKELFLLTLNHELMILKDFESTEENLEGLVENKETERKNLASRNTQVKSDIEAFLKTIEDLHEAKAAVEYKFMANCGDNKFSPFFKRIFKKRQKSEDEKDDDDEEMEKEITESEASSGVHESPEGSISNVKVGLKYLSEDQCPKGCSRKLYDMTFTLRHERHEIEAAIKKKENEIETFQLDLETIIERQEQAELDFSQIRGKLTQLRHRKQEMLNDVHTVVCLKMDQMQYFKSATEFSDIDNTLLFNNHNVTRLYSRVGKLALETIEAKRKHRINVIHLAKMKTDIKFMEKQITDLRDGTNQAMLKKFGRVIDLNEVEETILRRFAFEMQVEMRANAEDVKRQYFNKINELKKTKVVKEETLNRVIQEATEKLNILTVLEEEKNFLHKIVTMQSRKKELKDAGLPYRDVENDLSKLHEISNHQKEQIEMLQREIRALSLKTKSFVDARQDYETLNYSILQLRGECRFEDSICSNPDESILSSTRATTPDNEVFTEIYKAVKKFTDDNLSGQLEDIEIENVSMNLSKYLTNVAVNFPSTEADEILPEVINHFSNFLPKHIQISPESVSELIVQVIRSFNEGCDANRCEVLKEIIGNTIEAANQTAITSSSYLQVILTEIFKQMIITMRFADVASVDCINEIVERLSKLNAIEPKKVNIDEIILEIIEHANDNLEDDIDSQVLKRILINIISKLSRT